MASQIDVRPARTDERADVATLILDAYTEFEPFLTEANWRQMMRNLALVVERAPDGDLLVAQVGQRLAGTITYLAPGPRDYDRVPLEWAVMRALGVHPSFRGRGIGRILAEECLSRARADSASMVGLHTAEMMRAARTMYERMGFKQVRDFPYLGTRFLIYSLRLT
jgi:ribosomal protein S18 acetylase RimI-like enzyme